MATPTADDRGYALLDFGDGRRLERFGSRVVDRPAPAAAWPPTHPDAWRHVDLRFEPDDGWTGTAVDDPWSLGIDGLVLELRATDSGQVGLFPEHAGMLPWLRGAVDAVDAGAASALNLFASTGLATLALAAAGASVTHVDAARPAVAWARRNAAASGLADRPIRWIVDDVAGFVAREARRARRYDGVVLDPPSYGHGRGGRAWRLERDLPDLLDAALGLLPPTGFVLLTAHTTGLDADRLGVGLDDAADRLGRRWRDLDTGELAVATAGGRRLELGAFARGTFRA